jgi:hypothetical protein
MTSNADTLNEYSRSGGFVHVGGTLLWCGAVEPRMKEGAVP